MDDRPAVRIELTLQQKRMIQESTGLLEGTIQRIVEELNALPISSPEPAQAMAQ